MKTPNITTAQLVALIGSVVAVVVAAGLPIEDELQDSILDLVKIIAPIMLGSDAAIRVGRAFNANKISGQDT